MEWRYSDRLIHTHYDNGSSLYGEKALAQSNWKLTENSCNSSQRDHELYVQCSWCWDSQKCPGALTQRTLWPSFSHFRCFCHFMMKKKKKKYIYIYITIIYIIDKAVIADVTFCGYCRFVSHLHTGAELSLSVVKILCLVCRSITVQRHLVNLLTANQVRQTKFAQNHKETLTVIWPQQPCSCKNWKL